MTRPGGTRQQFEDFFAGELALRRAELHIAQAWDQELLPERKQAITDAVLLCAILIREINAERALAMKKMKSRPKREQR